MLKNAMLAFTYMLYTGMSILVEWAVLYVSNELTAGSPPEIPQKLYLYRGGQYWGAIWALISSLRTSSLYSARVPFR